MSDPLPGLDDAWRAAQSHWSPALMMRAPCCAQGPAIAWIDLRTREVHVDDRRVRQDALEPSLEALLAHELGHHLRYPGSLQTEARLRLLERKVIPVPGSSFVNLFTDLLINEEIGPRYAPALAAVYRALSARDPVRDPVFAFYLTVYEELWQLDPGSLLGDARWFTEAHPGHRADAQLLCQNLFALAPNVYTQFLYFLSVFSRYLSLPEDGAAPKFMVVMRCGPGEPTPEDWARALVPHRAEREAIERAVKDGWFGDDLKESLKDLEGRVGGLPGMLDGAAAETTEIMAAWYRHEAERWLFRPPKQRTWGDAIVPTTLDPWEIGDAPGAIDWVASLRAGMPLALAELVQRMRVPEVEGYEAPMWQTRMEIYLDVSGSMPDPRLARNAMTLAAQVLAIAAVRAGGWVRALVYSMEPVTFWTFSRSEMELTRFLMHYVGGGTMFPFGVLGASMEETARTPPIRVVITDRDFDANVDASPAHLAAVTRAAAGSPFLLLQHGATPARSAIYQRAGAKVIPVGTLDEFPRLAAALAHSLFPEDRRGNL